MPLFQLPRLFSVQRVVIRGARPTFPRLVPCLPSHNCNRLFSEQHPNNNEENPVHSTPGWKISLPAAFMAQCCAGMPLGMAFTTASFMRADAAIDTICTAGDAATSAVVFLGAQAVTSVAARNWLTHAEPRAATNTAVAAIGAGIAMATAGVYTQMLPLVYAGIGGFGGMGAGLIYTHVVNSVMFGSRKYRKGLAAGTSALGFGVGVTLLPTLVEKVALLFRKLPTYLGSSSEISTSIVAGKVYAAVDEVSIEVIELKVNNTLDSLVEGVYVAGSGYSGLPEGIALVGSGCCALLYATKFYYTPHSIMMDSDTAFNPPQPKDFHLLGGATLSLTVAGTSMLRLADPLINEVLYSRIPLANPESIAYWTVLMSFSVLGGNFLWGVVSDYIGRKETMYALMIGGIPIFVGMPALVQIMTLSEGAGSMGLFALNIFIGCSLSGVMHSVLPPYISDRFGEKEAGQYFPYALSYINTGTIMTLLMLPILNNYSRISAYVATLNKVSAESFEATFGIPFENTRELISSNSISLEKLGDLLPPGVDPAAHIYDSSFEALAILLTMGCIFHAKSFAVTDKMALVAPRIDISKQRSGQNKHSKDQKEALYVKTSNLYNLPATELKKMGVHAAKNKKRRSGGRER